MNTTHNATRGFSIVEFVLVIAITGIISLGLASVIELPRTVIEQRQNDGPDLASTQPALSLLQDDVQFATGAHCPAVNQLVLDRSDGSTVTWQWDGLVSHPLTRTVGGQTVTVIDAVKSVSFAVQSTSYSSPSGDDEVLAKTPVETAAFTDFVLKPGFVLGKAAPGKTKVNKIFAMKNIAVWERAGIYFVPTMIDDDAALLATMTLRLERRGWFDIELEVFEATPGKGPDRSKPVAHAVVPYRALPFSVGNVTIPLSSQRKLDKTKTYFVELRTAGLGVAGAIESEYLSDGSAAAPTGTNLFLSNDGGLTYFAVTSSIDGSQTAFSATAVKSMSQADADVPTNVVTVQTQVTMKLSLKTTTGNDSMVVTYPMWNAIAQVTQVK